MQKIVVVGSGIIGASIAYELTIGGARVTVLEKGALGGVASASGFGWINASFAQSDAYFALRLSAVNAFWALSDAVDLSAHFTWKGALWWEDEGDNFDSQVAVLSRRGYDAALLNADHIRDLCPALKTPPSRAIYTHTEGSANGQGVAQVLLQSVAEVVQGCEVFGVKRQGDRVTAVQTTIGDIACDHVVFATGAAMSEIPEIPLAVHVKKGLIVQTERTAPQLSQVLMTPDVHMRQAPDGHFLLGEIFSGDIDEGVDVFALAQDVHERARARLNFDLPPIAHLRIGQRPVPADGFPVVDTVGNMTVAVTHSGVTLGPLIGQMVADEILKGYRNPQLAEFRLRAAATTRHWR